jgi:hypothetical protein
MRGYQRVGVGADGVEGDVAEIEQPREPDHDVQPPAEHDVDEDLRCGIDRIALRRTRDQKRQQRSDDQEACGKLLPEPGYQHLGEFRNAVWMQECEA